MRGTSIGLLAMAGLLPCTGSVRVNGTEVVGQRPDRIRGAGMSTVLENHRVLSALSVHDNLRVAGGRRGARRDDLPSVDTPSARPSREPAGIFRCHQP